MNWVQALKVNYKSLSTAEKQAADYLLAQTEAKEVAKYTLRQCAAAAGRIKVMLRKILINFSERESVIIEASACPDYIYIGKYSI